MLSAYHIPWYSFITHMGEMEQWIVFLLHYHTERLALEEITFLNFLLQTAVSF